jgi:hypothetical protein
VRKGAQERAAELVLEGSAQEREVAIRRAAWELGRGTRDLVIRESGRERRITGRHAAMNALSGIPKENI